MSKIATIEVIVPDDVKTDDVFNCLRNNACKMNLKSLEPNPNDPPLTKTQMAIRVVYAARGAEYAGEVESAINAALYAIKEVTEVEFI